MFLGPTFAGPIAAKSGTGRGGESLKAIGNFKLDLKRPRRPVVLLALGPVWGGLGTC